MSRRAHLAVVEVAGHEGLVWAVRDCAAVPDGKGGIHPPTAQHGMREAVAAAKNIEAVVRGDMQKPFRFSTIGQLASIGHRPGVVQILGMRFSGWSLDLLFPREIEQLVTLRDVERLEKLDATLRAMRGAALPTQRQTDKRP